MLKDKALRTWANLRGWRTKRRIIVFESDDWGATRMRDPATLRELQRQGICQNGLYDRFDCLENRDDLTALFDLLDSCRDRASNPPVFTFNTVMGNPNFDAIRAGNFEKYVHESLWDSYKRYHGQDLERVWFDAMSASLIRPQFHAREHLNIGPWMKDLRDGCAETRLAFDQEFYGLKRLTSSHQRNYSAAYWPESPNHLREIQEIVVDGLARFKADFKYASETFIACNYVLPKDLEPTLLGEGIELIQSARGQVAPAVTGEVSIRRSFTGQQNTIGQLYSVRNVKFEPFEDQSRDWVASALGEIKESFFWRKPAIVSTHRVNYVSGMDAGHRDRNLASLGRLLTSIRKTWPDVEFMSSDQLLTVLRA